MNDDLTVVVFNRDGNVIWVGDVMQFCHIFTTNVIAGNDISMLTFGFRGIKYTYEYVLRDMLGAIERTNEND